MQNNFCKKLDIVINHYKKLNILIDLYKKNMITNFIIIDEAN